MDEQPKIPFWLIGVIAFLAVEFIAAGIGAVAGIGFMHGQIRGIEGAVIWAVIALWGAVPIGLIAGVIAYLKSK
jgi:magnesium-transporting ATPase (P-type)